LRELEALTVAIQLSGTRICRGVKEATGGKGVDLILGHGWAVTHHPQLFKRAAVDGRIDSDRILERQEG